LNGLNDLNLLNRLTRGFGSLAKVLEPASLVKEVKDDLEKSLRSYAKP
jgi:predicted DNA-binding transcriptional regulator YafY